MRNRWSTTLPYGQAGSEHEYSEFSMTVRTTSSIEHVGRSRVTRVSPVNSCLSFVRLFFGQSLWSPHVRRLANDPLIKTDIGLGVWFYPELLSCVVSSSLMFSGAYSILSRKTPKEQLRGKNQEPCLDMVTFCSKNKMKLTETSHKNKNFHLSTLDLSWYDQP